MSTARLLILFVLLFLVRARAFAESEQGFDVISDVDYGFIMGQPRIPWGEDPFSRTPGFASVPSVEEKFTLGGIIFSKQSPSAVVNGKMVQEGDLIGTRIVKRIGENYVILKRKQSEIELTLPPVSDEFPDDDRDELEEDSQ
jgi:hypothetical protein